MNAEADGESGENWWIFNNSLVRDPPFNERMERMTLQNFVYDYEKNLFLDNYKILIYALQIY